MDAETLAKLTPDQKAEIINQVRTQTALANMQKLLTQTTEKCFPKCVTSPGTSLSSSEQKCVAMCMDRYMDSFNVVSRAYSEKLQKESNRM